MYLAKVLHILLTVFPFSLDVQSSIVQAEDVDPKTELQQIDKEIEELQDLKNRYKASAARHEDEAIRWQFQQNLKQEARRAYQQADLDREMVKKIQVRIDYLEARKAQLIKEHPDAIQKSS